MPNSKRSRRQYPPADLSPRELGLRAFHAGRLDAAIAAWKPIARDPAVAQALAEAHFRRALSTSAADPIADLRRAAELAPADLRFPLHLGRLLHRAGDLAAAAGHYSMVLSREPGNTAVAKLLALLTLEQRSDADLSGLPGMSPALRSWAAPALAVLRRQPAPADEGALGTLWRGLGQLAAGDPGASATLSDERTLPASALEPLRRSFRATAAAQAGDTDAALRLWQRLYEAGERPPGMEERLATLLTERLATLVDSGEVAAAGDLAQHWASLAGGPAFNELRLQALDRAAQAAAAAGVWPQAVTLWDAARQILGRAQGLGSPRPILHNLALAYERQERWEDAADAWRALLRTRARKRVADTPDAQEEQRWAWVRTRIISCYRNAGRPDEAVAVFRQAIKLDPNDLDLRIQLADALLANEQERASQNEIQRILQIDPYHPEALLRQVEHLSERWQFGEAEQLVRELAERHPDRADLRGRVADVFMQHGREHSQYGNFQAAYNAFVEGERYQPDNPRFPLNQARMLGALRAPVDTQALIERALTVGGELAETWVLAIETWMMADKLDDARALLVRFERERAPSAEDYVDLGMRLMAAATPPPPLAFLAPLGPPPKPVDTPWTRLALELLDKAVALRPDDQRIVKSIATFLMLPRPDLARRFAEQAVQHAPDDPETLILLGMVLGLGDQVSEAKTALQRAAKLAQRAGRPDLREQAQELRRVVGTPMLRMMFSQAMQGFDELDELDELF